MVNRLREVLLGCPDEDLQNSIVSPETIRAFRLLKIDPKTLEKDVVVDLILDVFANSVFTDSNFKYCLILGIGDGEIDRIYKIFFPKGTLKKKNDKALAIASKKWDSKAKIGVILNDIFEGALYENEYHRKIRNFETYVDPVGKLPEMYDYQEVIVQSALTNLNNEVPRFIIQVPTGGGKTRIASEIFCDFFQLPGKGGLIWLAHTEELCEQAFESIRRTWTIKGKFPKIFFRKFGGIGSKYFSLGDNFLFTTYQSLVQMVKEKDILNGSLKSVRLVVCDEAHKVPAKTYAHSIEKLVEKTDGCIVGLTATPGRSRIAELENLKLSKFFNNNIIKAFDGENAIKVLQERGVLSKLKKSSISFDSHGSSDRKLMNIIDFLVKENKISRKILVFANSVDDAKVLSWSCKLNGLASFCITTDLATKDRTREIMMFKNSENAIIFNYGILSTGFDDPSIDAIVILRKTQSTVLYSQMLGRGLRGPSAGGKEVCKIFDLKENLEEFEEYEAIYDEFDQYWSK